MSEENAAYTTAVDLLRELTRERDAFGERAVRDLPSSGEAIDLDALQAETEATYETVLRPMEDRAFRVLAGLLRACDYDEVFRAVKEADARWLYPLMLDRALASLSPEGGDA